MNGMELQFLEALAFELYVDASHVTELLDCIEAEHVCRRSIPRAFAMARRSSSNKFELYDSQQNKKGTRVLTWVSPNLHRACRCTITRKASLRL